MKLYVYAGVLLFKFEGKTLYWIDSNPARILSSQYISIDKVHRL